MTIDKYYDISKSKRINLPFMTNKEASEEYGKGWGYSFVYSLTEIRDVFLMVKQHGVKSLSHFTEHHIINNKIPYSKTKWEKRRVLEVLNALVNFGLIDKDYNVLRSDCFSDSSAGTPYLTSAEKSILKKIYLDYFRFKELFLLYINPILLLSTKKEIQNITEYNLVHNSNVLYSFTEGGKYVDSFFTQLEDNPLIYTIPELNKDKDKNGGVKRFWDVFIAWGENLGFLEKFNMLSLGCKLSNNKSFACSYILSEEGITTSLLQYVKDMYPHKRSIDLSQLVFNLCIDYRVSCEEAKNYILNEYKVNTEQISLVRTSEVFIKEREFSQKEKVFYPKYKDSYISNIIIRI
jgi:hypothetical protein